MASIDYSIKDVEKLVRVDGKVKNVQVARLTAPGENNLSLVLRVDFEIENNGHSKILSSVAKRLPLIANKNDGFDLHGHVMKNEIKWYLEIVPLLKDFARKNEIKMEFYPEHYGSRFSLNPRKQEADSDSVLLLENLIPQGYHNDDRYIGCDLNTSKAVLRSLALFHALPLAIKMKEPETFKILKDFLENARPKFPSKDGPPGPDGKRKAFGPPPGAKKLEKVLFEGLVSIPDFAPYISKIKPLLDQHFPDIMQRITKEPWNTIAHTDFWVNNVMTKSTKEQEPLVKIVDFQMCSYGSYAKDLVFFLLSSVRNDVTKDSMDDLLRVYYDEFIAILQKTKSGLELTYEDYLEEVCTAASESEILHALMFSTVIFGAKGTGVDAAVEEFRPDVQMAETLRNMNQYHKDKLILIASQADKRNWIKSF